ncbi:MAG: hypothetical protein OQJ95_01235 [Kangiella sp.]|nr:hypothetical protein [Kangiella sp.]MCW9028104.1 hypothetical protein [Kangiella sp.]
MNKKCTDVNSRWFLTWKRQPIEHLSDVYVLVDGQEVEAWWCVSGKFLRRADGAILESERWRYR